MVVFSALSRSVWKQRVSVMVTFKAFQRLADKWSQSYWCSCQYMQKNQRASSVETATEAEMLPSWREHNQLESRMAAFRPFRTARPPCVDTQAWQFFTWWGVISRGTWWSHALTHEESQDIIWAAMCRLHDAWLIIIIIYMQKSPEVLLLWIL